ncbi:MAG: DUF1028 domain-containing protein [Rhodobacteraceae bacterium]|jgi:uncharacterized Ntn-hydrolase superfamily protein|nr:DUF1028 domain-containing protein [Paracoccaceae bacterium]
MTFSVLTFDEKEGIFAAAAATGSLCVGGWVLRGDIESGLVASQGTSPSSFWRDDCLRSMYTGQSASEAINLAIANDSGRNHRQIIALDKCGTTSGFTGNKSVSHASHITEQNLAVAGNMIAGSHVLEAVKKQVSSDRAPIEQRMLNALQAGKDAGGDNRGLLSAALLVLSPNHPPLDLRIDYSSDPLSDLQLLLDQSKQSPYYDWLSEVPIETDRKRAPQEETLLTNK